MHPEVVQQLELLVRTIDDTALALLETRAAAEDSPRYAVLKVDLATAQDEVLAELRRTRVEMRARTRAIRGLAARLPRG